MLWKISTNIRSKETLQIRIKSKVFSAKQYTKRAEIHIGAALNTTSLFCAVSYVRQGLVMRLFKTNFQYTRQNKSVRIVI
jgi:hypothetical protein